MQARSAEITIETSIAEHLGECDIPEECQLGSFAFFELSGENQQACKCGELGDTV